MSSKKSTVHVSKNTQADPNIGNFSGHTALFEAVSHNSVEIVELLLKNGADPNVIIPPQNKCALYCAALDGNIKVINLLLEYKLDIGKHINIILSNGYTPFTVCFENGRLNVIKLFHKLSIENNFEINMYPTRHSDEMNIIHLGANSRSYECVKYVLENMKFLDRDVNIINHVSTRGETAIWFACLTGQLEIAKIIYKNSNKKADLFIVNKNQNSTLHVACQRSRNSVIKWLINTVKTDFPAKLDSFVNAQNVQQRTPLMAAIVADELGSIATLFEIGGTSIDIETIVQENGVNGVEFATYLGDVDVIKLIFRELFKRHKVTDWKSFKKSGLLSQEYIEKWHSMLKQKSYNNDSAIHFLLSVRDNALKYENYELLEILIGIGESDVLVNSSNEQRREIKLKFEELERLSYVIQVLIKYVENKEILQQFCNIVLSMIDKKEVLNDTLLLLVDSVIHDKLETSLVSCVHDCITQLNRRDMAFFKMCLLNSLVLCKNNLFYKINEQSIGIELKKQQQFIKDNIIKMSKNDSDSWNNLVEIKAKSISSKYLSQLEITRSNDLLNAMENSGIEIDYKSNKELINDPVSGFAGSNEYNNNGYLVKLLIAANKMNDTFQVFFCFLIFIFFFIF